MSKVQAVLFNRENFTSSEARKWLKKNKMKSIKRVHKTKKYLRYRIKDPSKFKRFRTVQEIPEVKLIIGIT